jgi:hypothetical protein
VNDCRECALLRVRLAAAQREHEGLAADRARLTKERDQLRDDLHRIRSGLAPRHVPRASAHPVGSGWFIDALRQHGPLTALEMARITGRSLSTVWVAATHNARFITKRKQGNGEKGSRLTYTLRGDAPAPEAAA